jgi:hypothetical protein
LVNGVGAGLVLEPPGVLDREGEGVEADGVAGGSGDGVDERSGGGEVEDLGREGVGNKERLGATPDEINLGLDWLDLLPSFPRDGRIVAYSTTPTPPREAPPTPIPPPSSMSTCSPVS